MTQRSLQTRTRSLIRVAAAAATLLGGVGLAAPAAAQGVIGPGSGRAGATVALVLGLVGVVVGGLALARSVGRISTGNGRGGAIVALVLGLVGMLLAGLHLAASTGGIGTGNGRGGAIVAVVLGLVGMVLGGLALWRGRAGEPDRPDPGITAP
ncbi:DUF6223 family protein [Sorangium sp. So ce260]|uniref:DUF6223 family protein n=1 Tax=Sorangium sp. So ce260 TaxID=3133291 RepID=UPI003F61253E